MGGNTRSQLLSRVKQNGRCSGFVTLSGVYRRLQEKDRTFKIVEIDELRKLHGDGKLLACVVEMEKKSSSKLSPENEKALGDLLKVK